MTLSSLHLGILRSFQESYEDARQGWCSVFQEAIALSSRVPGIEDQVKRFAATKSKRNLAIARNYLRVQYGYYYEGINFKDGDPSSTKAFLEALANKPEGLTTQELRSLSEKMGGYEGRKLRDKLNRLSKARFVQVERVTGITFRYRLTARGLDFLKGKTNRRGAA